MAFAVIAIMLVATSAAFADAANQVSSKNRFKNEIKTDDENRIKTDDNSNRVKIEVRHETKTEVNGLNRVKLQQQPNEKNIDPGVIPENWLFNRHRFVGKGVALPLNNSDNESVKYVKLTITAKKGPYIMAPCTDQGCPVPDIEIRGKLNLQGDVLDVRNVTFGNETVSGQLYRNGTLVGSFNLAKSGWFNVWHGTLNVDGNSYNLFIVKTKQFNWKWQWPAMISPAEIEEE